MLFLADFAGQGTLIDKAPPVRATALIGFTWRTIQCLES